MRTGALGISQFYNELNEFGIRERGVCQRSLLFFRDSLDKNTCLFKPLGDFQPYELRHIRYIPRIVRQILQA